MYTVFSPQQVGVIIVTAIPAFYNAIFHFVYGILLGAWQNIIIFIMSLSNSIYLSDTHLMSTTRFLTKAL
jgi:hypothetical protein